jgi:hypothetical protein
LVFVSCAQVNEGIPELSRLLESSAPAAFSFLVELLDHFLALAGQKITRGQHLLQYRSWVTLPRHGAVQNFRLP